jgi:hypothetical protein
MRPKQLAEVAEAFDAVLSVMRAGAQQSTHPEVSAKMLETAEMVRESVLTLLRTGGR